MNHDPNRDAAIRYTDEQARQDQIAERAFEIAQRMAADRLRTVKGCRDLVLESEPHIWGDMHTIVENAEKAMDVYLAPDARPGGHVAILYTLRACVNIAKTLHDCAMNVVQDDADDEAEREFGEDE